uniref:hypothetical protein n=1 Tax=Brachybacterium conglomeratum TaxID=47846 RepID=UPI00366CB7D7
MVIRLVNIVLFFSDVRELCFAVRSITWVLCYVVLFCAGLVLKVSERTALVSVCQGFRKAVSFGRR